MRMKVMLQRLSSIRKGESGAVMILTVAALFGLLAVSSLVIDIGNANQRSRTAQSVADASALAGSWDLIVDTATSKTTAAAYVADNLDATLPLPSTCVSDTDVTSDTTCYTIATRTIQITSPWDGSDLLIRVDVCDNVSTSFARLIGFDTLTVCRIAIAEVEPPHPPTPGGPAIQAFGPGAKKGFETTGNATVWTDGDIYISSLLGEAFLASGSGGVTVEGDVWYDVNGGGCAKPPLCGDPGFLGSLPQACDPTGADSSIPCPGGTTFFNDVYLNHPINDIDFAQLTICLNDDFAASGCAFYDPGDGFPVHTVHNEGQTDGPARTGSTASPSCDNGDATMLPGHYSTSSQYSITGCVILMPGIYLFDGGFDMEGDGYVRGNNILLINGHDKTISRNTKSAVCITGITSGSFENFLYYQNPANSNDFVITADSVLILAGIIYVPAGGIEVNGADAGTIGGDGIVSCLGETVILGGSIVGRTVLVKSDGKLSINALEGAAAGGGGGWVRLME